MLFNSLIFFGFITIVFLVYPRLGLRGQNLFLLLASYIFYSYWDWRFTVLLLTSTVVDFWVGQKLQEPGSQKRRRLLLLVSITVNLGILGFFKYFNFFIDSAASALAAIGLEPHVSVLRVILPIGISFYTFRTMTYTIDIYRSKVKPTKNFVDYALFVSFFPELLAGPIERASSLLPQISTPRQITRAKILTGLNLVLLGYFKKVAIADTLAPIVDHIFAAPAGMSSGQLWTGVYAYTFQIYGDFSGYTDIARGISRILGFETMENFSAPYLSRSITEFWRRWHISLSTWFRDYLYIPLGGNRLGRARTYANLIITMCLCGLWHGAAWTFVLWGLLHGLCLSGHRMVLGENKPDFSWPQTFSGWGIAFVKMFLMFQFVALAWVLFRAPNLKTALVYLEGLFRFHDFTGFATHVLFAGSLVMALDVAQTWCGTQTWLTDRQDLRSLRFIVAQLLLISVLSAAIAHLGTVTPFIYFQF
ncbi:MAG: MBOAT family protein [Syntrophales bacterium LBB04]|nr:MBOAT family protein [Syntrophales bacterium LBB04]